MSLGNSSNISIAPPTKIMAIIANNFKRVLLIWDYYNQSRYFMKVGSYVYNTLSRWARRLNVAKHYLSISMSILPIAFVILLWGVDKNNEFMVIAGAIIAAMCIYIWNRSLRDAEKDQKTQKEKDDKREESLIHILESINIGNKHIQELIEEIRNERIIGRP